MGGYRFDAELGRGMAMNDDFEFFNERLFYNEKTGIFYWRETELIHARMRGREAGTLSVGYVVISVKKDGKQRIFKAHRLAWLFINGNFPKLQIDHINGIKTDNRIENLRETSSFQNMQNLKTAQKNNKLGVLGVNKKGRKYRASIGINGKIKEIGRFATIEEASNAYIQAKRDIHSFCTI